MTSWVVFDRILETERASNAAFREQTAGRPLRSNGKGLSDDELLEKLRSFGVELDRPKLALLFDKYLSAEEIAGPLIETYVAASKAKGFESDWIWICICALWERWFPDKPSFEMLDDKMQSGYEATRLNEGESACWLWLDAWDDFLQLIDKAGVESVEEFDDLFRGTQAIFNWVQDLEDELWGAGLRNAQLLVERVAVCEEGLRRFGTDDELTIQNRRCSLAESYFELGETHKADALFREWLDADPRWGWGWIGWSDCYRFTRTGDRDLNRAEALLREGLAIPAVEDIRFLAERLMAVLEEDGRVEEAAAAKAQNWSKSAGQVVKGEGLGQRKKVGRNEPCPCGSGKKFKKCCG
jgi:tetratricopeptide (TPR) repeat protein